MAKKVPDHELFDISDVTFDFTNTKNMKEIVLVIKAKRSLNLMKYYLALKNYVEEMEAELGILEAADGHH